MLVLFCFLFSFASCLIEVFLVKTSVSSYRLKHSLPMFLTCFLRGKPLFRVFHLNFCPISVLQARNQEFSWAGFQPTEKDTLTFLKDPPFEYCFADS